MNRSSRRTASAAIVMLLCGVAGFADAAEVRLLSAGAMKAFVTDLAEGFTRETGHTVTIATGTAGEIRGKVAAGEPADVAIATDVVVEQLEGQGHVAPGSRADIARTGIGVCVLDGAPRPDISTPEAFKQAMLAAKSIVYVDPARGATSGIHLAGVLQRLGIADAVKGKTVLVPGGYAADVVAKGQAEICVHQISEILPVKGVTLVGPLPKELQKVTTYSAGVVATAREPAAAKALVAYLARPAFKVKLAAMGLDYRDGASGTDGAEANKKLVVEFYRMVFVDKKVREGFEQYVVEGYIQHNPMVPTGREAAVKLLSERIRPESIADVKRVIAEGDLVVLHVHSRSNAQDRGRAIVDIFRVKDGKIVEHWDVIQPVPEQAANDNTMF